MNSTGHFLFKKDWVFFLIFLQEDGGELFHHLSNFARLAIFNILNFKIDHEAKVIFLF